MINSTDGTSTSTSLPTFNSTPKYYYSVIGNTYLSYAYKNSSGGTAGNGVYGYIIPSGFTLSSTLIIPSVAGSYNNPQYTQVGTGVAWIPGVWSSYGNPIYVLQNTSVASGFILGLGAINLCLYADLLSGIYWYEGMKLIIDVRSFIPPVWAHGPHIRILSFLLSQYEIVFKVFLP
jgi:hypothetical protein